ncbi:glycophorin-C isoform X2 [Conger conger]|uniref:glycophorin-C isoform X2 n=1 Tax=Conger conger TaxID=82655 RepID=UPI002A598E26|nr:glycophorin-C isoform X2 [Conger conger]
MENNTSPGIPVVSEFHTSFQVNTETTTSLQQSAMENNTSPGIPVVSEFHTSFQVNTETTTTTTTTTTIYNLTTGVEAEDGSYNTILAGVIAAVILVLICLAVVLLHYIHQRKGTYRTNEAKGTERPETPDAALKRDPGLEGSMDDGNKEYFI